MCSSTQLLWDINAKKHLVRFTNEVLFCGFGLVFDGGSLAVTFQRAVCLPVIEAGHGFGVGIPAEELFGNIWFYIVLLLIFNPVMEELLFRKILLERLTCLGFKWAVICSAVLFALPHVVSQGVPQMFYTFGLGLVWGYITLKTGKLWPAIILHSLSNIYGAFIPMIAAEIHPLLSGLFVMFTMGVMVPLTVLFLIKEHKKS